MTISHTTLSANTATNTCQTGCGSRGGGIYNDFGRMTISNSTVSGNVAEVVCLSLDRFAHCGSAGGGIFDELRTSTINNSTLSGNGAFARCILPPCVLFVGEGNIFGSTLQNSIVANSPSGGNCGGGTISNGYNLSSDNTCNFNGPGDMNKPTRCSARWRTTAGLPRPFLYLPEVLQLMLATRVAAPMA